MNALDQSGNFPLGTRHVNRIGYGAMQLAGPGVYGPPKDSASAIAVLRTAVEAGVNHIDTSDFYGPHITNQIIKEALHPYCNELVIATKVGATRGADSSWNLSYLVRQHPFRRARLQDDDLSVNFADLTGPTDRVAVVATEPLTTDEAWLGFAPGELKVFVDGLPFYTP